MRRPLVAGNWKMNCSRQSNDVLLQSLLSVFDEGVSAELLVCSPDVYIAQLASVLEDSQIAYGAQDVSVHSHGAYTGEVSAGMLEEYGCTYVIVGHSERRQYHHESNQLVAQKALAAIVAGLTPIVCVGETLDQRDQGQTLQVIGEQLAAVKVVLGSQLSSIVVAYEPVWAIGTGLTATPQQAQEVHEFIREQLGSVASDVRIVYGGSVKSDNAADLFAQKDIDGALVGGASLDANDFIAIAKAAV